MEPLLGHVRAERRPELMDMAVSEMHASPAWYFTLIVLECAALAFLEKSDRCLSNFQARKLCHAGSGLLLLQLDSRDQQARYFVYMVGLSALAMTWEIIPGIKPFRFGKERDIGMTAYMIVAMLWFSQQLPVRVLAPMFFADPAGAIVGKYLSSRKGVPNPVWCRAGGTTKTVGGSAAVFFFTAATFASPATLLQRLAVAALAVLAEALGGAFDNLLLVIVVVGARVLFTFLETGNCSLEFSPAAPTVAVTPSVQAFLYI